jgi:hypothetical protein
MRLVGAVIFLVISACTAGTGFETTGTSAPIGLVEAPADFETGYPPAPDVPSGPLEPRVVDELGGLLVGVAEATHESEALDEVVAANDARVAWLLADMMRFVQVGEMATELRSAFARLTGVRLDSGEHPPFVDAMNHLFAWDLPAFPEYDQLKADLYTTVEPGWLPFFEQNVSIDWRYVTWGGVLIDDRPFGDTAPCPDGCIPALDDPPTTDAAGGSWYPDDSVVFGVVLGDEAIALPQNQMEVHEMVNLGMGGRRIGVPYCTLCGSAQAYLTDSVPEGFETAVLRTSGLLSRSNKVMYDLITGSVFDTFTGEGRSGPLAEAGVTLEQITVVASTWGDWKTAHPETRILAEDGGLGRSYPADPLGDRDDDGPIFPVGPVDPRLPVQELVVGVVADGTPIAFPVAETRRVLQEGGDVMVDGITAMLDGDGIRVVGADGELPAHQAYWFAWSQFHPTTVVWTTLGG